jgi:dienelactone hydrolase
MTGLRTALILAALATQLVAPAVGQSTVPPLTFPGPFPVACSNIAQDFTRLAPGEDVQVYWEGVPRDDGSPRYITDLLSDPAHSLLLNVAIPGDASVYGSFAGKSLPYAVIVCYPTSASNARADYALPNGKSVPRMQRGAESPLWPDAMTRYPLLLFSHGYPGSPTANDYIDAVALLASFGYVVAAPYHGDGRFGSLQLEGLADATYLAAHLRDFLAMEAVRALSLSATLDLLLAMPEWGARIDPVQIGAFGAGLGGESALLMAGAGLTTSVDLGWAEVERDRRLKAAVGYVPYFGYPIFPAFGRDQHGLDGVAIPYLAIGGTADTTAPIDQIAAGVLRLQAPRELVALVNVKHGFDPASAPDLFTWALAFLDAEVRGDVAARARLSQMTNVAGGGDDRVIVPLQPPSPVNYGGLWWNAPFGSEKGWGLNLAHQGDVIFATWFTYDANGNAWWLAMTADAQPDGTFRGTLYESMGPPFYADPFDPGAVVATPVGSGTLSFTDADNGTFAYVVNGISQSKSITREVFGPVPTCVFGSPIAPALSTHYQDLWWASPWGSESGWGMNLTQQGNIIFITWFTYDGFGKPLWLSSTTTAISPNRFTGTVYRTTGPPFYSTPFDPAVVSIFPVGAIYVEFLSGDLATLAYTVNSITQAKTLTREVLRSPGTLCR